MFSSIGCKRHCGRGFEYDNFADIIGRFFLWVLPVLVLAAHFHFLPFGNINSLSVVASIIGNPIGSLYSMLTRLELFRRQYRRAVAKGFPHSELGPGNVAADIAAVCAACDELGLNDPFDSIVSHLEKRRIVKTVAMAQRCKSDISQTFVNPQKSEPGTAQSDIAKPTPRAGGCGDQEQGQQRNRPEIARHGR
jgi:hypothetical protein